MRAHRATVGGATGGRQTTLPTKVSSARGRPVSKLAPYATQQLSRYFPRREARLKQCQGHQEGAGRTTTIFGPAVANGAAMDPERARELLAQERERIERSLSRLGHEDTGEPADEFDPANQASDLYQDELDEGLSDDLREELAAVERAEARLAAGTYGRSIESGRPIPDERLEAFPTAERTVDEEAR